MRADGNRRGSSGAINKRRAARHFNEVLTLGAGSLRDGRTEKRRLRLLGELREGKRGRRLLKPIEVLLHVQALLDMGELLAAIRKVAKPARMLPTTEELVTSTRALHRAYGFRAEVYAFVGIDGQTLQRAGVGVPALAKAGRKVRATRAA